MLYLNYTELISIRRKNINGIHFKMLLNINIVCAHTLYDQKTHKIMLWLKKSHISVQNYFILKHSNKTYIMVSLKKINSS